MRAKGRVRISMELLKKALGLHPNLAVDTVETENGRGIVGIVVSSDMPAYMPTREFGGTVKLTFDVAEGQEIPSVDIEPILPFKTERGMF